MYLPSKNKYRIAGLIILALVLFFLPFRSAIEDLFIFFSRQFRYTPIKQNQKFEELKKENLSLKLKIEKFQQLTKENQTLKKALNFKSETGVDLIGVDVIAFSPSSWGRYILVNAGSDNAVEKAMFVVDEDGNLVGKIIEVNQNHSKIILVNDPNFNLSVFVGEQGFGLLEGDLIGARLLYIEDSDQVKKGDEVWIKLESSVIPVGKVKDISNNSNDLFWNVEVKLNIKTSFFDKLFILK